MSRLLSVEVDHLVGVHKKRYIEKINLCGLQTDPYLLPPSQFMDIRKAERLPNFTPHDLYRYVINGISPYTGEDLKAYKSLDAYKFFVSGWVTSTRYCCVEGCTNYLFMAQVHHSQALSATKLKPWVVVQADGTVVCGHCTCKAGLGEVCSHVTALLYTLDSSVRQLDARSCTDGPRQWGLPPAVKLGRDLFEEGAKIDFSHPAKRLCGQQPKQNPNSTVRQKISLSTEAVEKFYRALDLAADNPKDKSGLLRILPKYCHQFQPRVVSLDLPPPLTDLFSLHNRKLSDIDLAQKCVAAFDVIKVTQEQAVQIEAETRSQSQSRLWHDLRAGRVTASRFKAAARTDPTNPSKSLIKQICYPDLYKFSSAATRWGCQHEETARQAYFAWASQQHQDLTIRDAGLHIHPSYPYIGASPDALTNCSCCGGGILEVKCPHCAKDTGVLSATGNKHFCLITTEHGTALDRNHHYYYQVQAQLFATGREFCDFVVWSPTDFFLQRIVSDVDLMSEAVPKIKAFFQLGLLPELLAKKYTWQDDDKEE